MARRLARNVRWARLLSAESCEWFTGARFALVAEVPAGEAARFADPVQTALT